jgi:catalase
MTPRPHAPSTDWRESFWGGSEQAEKRQFAVWAQEIQDIQHHLRTKNNAPVLRRGFHAKQHVGVDNAALTIPDQIPSHLRVGPFQPGARYPAIVRLSNASGTVEADNKGDLRGLAARVRVSTDTNIDLLATNAPVSFARDAEQFMIFAKATTGPRLKMIPTLLSEVGLPEAIRMLRTAISGTRRPVLSLATEQYWSRGAYRFGDYAARFTLVPMAASAPEPQREDPNYLRHEITTRLRSGAVGWKLMVQLFEREETTPIENAATNWNTQYSTIGHIMIPAQDLSTPESGAMEEAVDLMEFNPWNTVDELRPLGNINRARLSVYQASQDIRRRR